MVKLLNNFLCSEEECEAELYIGNGQPAFHADNAALHDILTVAVRDDPALDIAADGMVQGWMTCVQGNL
jgi:hypothetical protein